MGKWLCERWRLIIKARVSIKKPVLNFTIVYQWRCFNVQSMTVTFLDKLKFADL